MRNRLKSKRVLFLITICCFFSAITFAQDDPSRQSSQLPSMIGPGNKANRVKISGTLKIEGFENLSQVPTFWVSLLINGATKDRREVKNKGSFMFNDIAIGSDAELVLQADNIEVKRISNLLAAVVPTDQFNSNSPKGRTRQENPSIPKVEVNHDVRQDITVLWIEIQNRKEKPSAISVGNLYQRSKENQELFDKAVTASKSKSKDDAIAFFKTIVGNDEKDFVSWTELGTLYFGKNKLSDAESAYQKAIDLNPKFTLALLNLGKLYISQKNADKAIEILTKSVEASPDSPDTNQYLGEAYLLAKKGSKAVGYLNESIKLAPIEKAEVHLRLGALYNAAGLKDRAANEYKLFLSKVPTYKEKEDLEKYIKENSPK